MYDIEMFKYEFKILNNQSLSIQQVKALEAIVKVKMASKKQKEMYENICYQVNDLQSRLSIYKSIKQFGI